jgi:hypothetical protein
VKKSALVVGSLMVMSLTAFAGKAERDMMTKEVMPAVKEAAAKVKASCGCAMAITVDEGTVKAKDDMYVIKHMAGYVAEGAPKYCTDDASKKAVCQMKTLVLAKAAKAEFTFKDGKGTATTDGQGGCSFEMMTRVLDK